MWLKRSSCIMCTKPPPPHSITLSRLIFYPAERPVACVVFYRSVKMTKLSYITCIILNLCTFAVGTLLYVSQLESAVRVQPGRTTTLHCFTPDDGHFKVFWLKLQNGSALVLVALAESDKTGIIVGEKFQDASKYRLTWNQLSFNLSVLNIEQTDIAVYFCGIIIFNRMFFGNGTRLMFEEHFNGTGLVKEKEDHWSDHLFVYALLTLVPVTVASILLNIILYLQKTDTSKNQRFVRSHKLGKIQMFVLKDVETQVVYTAVKDD
ncbi:uncharacterized protein LOC131544367 isoform X1 [Onychostoma macrolepis]|uniref:uncharacterized protein LOC131544367 isoform X1 n=2 Tax=Onychostoma macrolepis TaxID=369639 RepID=UPI002729E6AD|nr:uncharacterized protein LOC131544367 isoform X1 [Onychostoma macrolepis]